MIRRARLSFKPNVRPGGRIAAAGSAGSGRDGGAAPAAEPGPGNTASSEDCTTAPVSGDPGEAQPAEETSAEPAIEAAAAVSNEVPQANTPAPLQRRKRISTLPNLAKPRVSNSASAAVPSSKPSQVDVPSTPPVILAPCKNEGSSSEKGKVLSPQKSQVPVSSPQEQHVTLPEKRTPVPQVPQFSPYKKSVLKPQEFSPAKPVECAQTEEPSPLKERPSQKSCSNELFEVIKKTNPKKMISGNLEKERIRRAQKLRDLLKAELRKERKSWKEKHPVINPMVMPEKSKMTMRDFIHFIPMSNPMSSSLEENKSSEKPSPVESQVVGLGGKNSPEEDDLDEEEEEDDSQLLAPRVKVAEDGSIILDEESLTVEVSRTKAPIIEGNDPIFERGSTTTYSSFRKNIYSKPWSEPETNMFYLAISMVGTDFSMICQLFPHRERIEIKNKFKREERVSGWRIDKAFREKKEFDFEFFAQLLEKALEEGKKRKSKRPRKTTAKSRKKQKDKIAEESLCDESVMSEEEGADARTAEKENKRSLDDDELSVVADSVPVKKKRSKKKKDTTKEAEEEIRDSHEDDLAPKQKKKSRKNKSAARDTDTGPELQDVDDGSLKEAPPVKKTRMQKTKPNYKESEFEDDENDADLDMAEDFVVDDEPVSCKSEEVESLTEKRDEPDTRNEMCKDENSLVLFSEESDYQSDPHLSGLLHSLSEVNEALSQASDAYPFPPHSMLDEMEAIDVTQEDIRTCDKSDSLDKASVAASGQCGDQDSESKDKPKVSQGHGAQPASNESKASMKKSMSTEEQSDRKHQADPTAELDVGKSNMKNVQKDLAVDQLRQAGEAAKSDDSFTPYTGEKEFSIKPPVAGRVRLQRPKPNLPARTSTRKEKLDVTDSKVVPMEGAEMCADVLSQNKTEDTENLNRDVVDSSIEKNRQHGHFAAKISSPVKDVGPESDLSKTEESKTVQQDCDKEDTSKEKPSLPVRGRLRPKPNLTRAPAKNKPSDAEQAVHQSQASDIKSPSRTPGREEENGVKERVESSFVPQDECGKTPLQPVPLARGRFQKPKPNLIKANSRKEAFEGKQDSAAPSAGHTEEDAGRDVQSDGSSGKQENEMLMNIGSRSSQDSSMSEINSHPLSLQLIEDNTVKQDHLTEASVISDTQSVKSPIKPAPPARGRLQRPKPNLVRSSGRKGEFEMKESESFEAASGTAEKGSPTELAKEVPSLEQHVLEFHSEKTDSVMPREVDGENLPEEPNAPVKPAELPKGRFQRPKPNLSRAVAKKDGLTSPDEPKTIPKGDACIESSLESKDATSNIPVNEVETAPLLAKRDKRSLAEEDSDILEKSDSGMPDKERSASDDERKTLKPLLTRGMLQRPKPNLSKSAKRSAATAQLVSTTQEEEERTGTTSTGNTGSAISPGGDVLGGDAEGKSAVKDAHDKAVAQPDKEQSASDDEERKALKPILTRGVFQTPKPNLSKSVKRSAATAPLVSTTQEEEERTGTTFTGNTGSVISPDGEVLSDGDAEGKSAVKDAHDKAVAQPDKERSASGDERKTLKPVLTRGMLHRPKPNLSKSVKRSAATAPLESMTQEEEERTGTTSTGNTDSISTDGEVLSGGDAGVKSAVKDAHDKADDDKAVAQPDKEQSASDDERKTLKPVLTRGMLQRPKPNLSKSVKRSAATAPLVPTTQEEEERTGTTSTGNNGSEISPDEVLSGGDAEVKSAVKDAHDKAVIQPEEVVSNAQQGVAPSLKPVRARFTKPSPNLGRAAMRKETSTTDPKTVAPKKDQETLKDIEDPKLLKIEDTPDQSIAGHGCKESGHAIEEKPGAIKPAQLKRGRLIRPVPNLVRSSNKTLSPLQSKANEDLNSTPTIQDKDKVVATTPPVNKRKAPDSNVDLSPKKICPSGTSQKPSCLSDSEVDQVSLSNEPPSSSKSSSVQDTGTPQHSRFGRPLRKLSTPSVSPKSENSSDRPDKDKAVRNAKSSTTKAPKPVSSKSKGKTTLVKLRATQQQEDDEDDADQGFEEDSYDLSPDMQNQAPVFVPFSLRSPKPVTAEIEETLEELEIPVDVVDLATSTTQDMGRTTFQHVVDPEAQPEKREQCDGSAEAAMALISMGSCVYKPSIGEFLSSDQCTESQVSRMGQQDNREQFTSIKLLSSPPRSLLSSPHDVCATESRVIVAPSMVEDPYCAPNVGDKTQTDVISSTGNFPNPINDTLAFPVEQISYPVLQGNALQHEFSSQDVSISDCLLGPPSPEQEATFILTLVEIPINDDYAYSCDSNMAESLPAPVLITSGSSQVLTPVNPSTETLSYEPCVAGQEDQALMFEQTSRKRSAQCIGEGDDVPSQKKSHISEQVVDLESRATAVEMDGDGKVAYDTSVAEFKIEELAGVSQIGATTVRKRSSKWPTAKTCGTVPVEMPGMSVTDSLNRNLPLVYAAPVATSKTPLKRPGKKPLGFLPLVCKEKQLKKENEENRKKKTPPRLKCRKLSPAVHGRQKGSPGLSLENANDSEVPSPSSSIFSPAEGQSAIKETKAASSASSLSDNQKRERHSPSKSHDLSTEEEAAPVSEYFFSDIFMEVDD